MGTNEQEPIQLQWALYFHAVGLKLIRVHGIADGRCTCGNPGCPHPGKHPIGTGWNNGGHFKDNAEIRQFWAEHPNANFGILTAGLVVIDIDARNGGAESYKKHLAPLLENVQTLLVQTGSDEHSRHIFFSDPNSEIKNKVGLFPGVDVKAAGGFVVGPGSLHKSGRRYGVLRLGGSSENQFQISTLPQNVRSILTSPLSKEPCYFKEDLIGVGKIVEGTRNTRLTSYAGSLRRQGRSVEDIKSLLRTHNQSLCVPPLPESEIEKIAESVGRYPAEKILEWRNPDVEFAIKASSYQDMPINLIPEAFSAFIQKKEKALGVPRSAIAVSLLTVASAILGAAFRVKPSQSSEYQTPLNLWGLVIAPPGSRKTSVLDIAQPVLKLISKFFSDRRKEAETKVSTDLARLKVELRNAKKDMEKSASLEFEIAKLKKFSVPRWGFVTNDSTPEALALLYQWNPRGIFLFNDELDGVLSKTSKSGYEGFRSFLCESWTGARPYQIDRIERGIIEIKSATLAVLGGVQPDVISVAFNEEIRKGMGGDGLLARFQLCSIYSSKELREPDSDIDLTNETQLVMGILMALHELTKEFNLVDVQPAQVLHLSKSASDLFSLYNKKIGVTLADDENLNQAYKSHVAKFGRLVLCLAGIFHIIDSAVQNKKIESVIDENWMQSAIELADYYDEQAQTMYFSIGKNSSAKTLISRIRNGDVTDKMSVRSVYKKGWTCLQSREDVLNAIEAISESNWAQVENDVPVGGGRPTDIIRLNPRLTEWLKNRKNIDLGRPGETDVRGRP